MQHLHSYTGESLCNNLFQYITTGTWMIPVDDCRMARLVLMLGVLCRHQQPSKHILQELLENSLEVSVRCKSERNWIGKFFLSWRHCQKGTINLDVIVVDNIEKHKPARKRGTLTDKEKNRTGNKNIRFQTIILNNIQSKCCQQFSKIDWLRQLHDCWKYTNCIYNWIKHSICYYRRER